MKMSPFSRSLWLDGGGLTQKMKITARFFSADCLSKADQAVKKKEEKFLQENSFFIFMSVSNQISFFTNIFELIYPN